MKVSLSATTACAMKAWVRSSAPSGCRPACSRVIWASSNSTPPRMRTTTSPARLRSAFRHPGLEVVGDGAQPGALAARRRVAGEQGHGLRGRRGQLLGDGRLGRIGGLGGVAAHGSRRTSGSTSPRAQAHEAVDVALVVGRHAQVAELVGRRLAHAQQEHRHAVAHVHRQHVVVELAGLAGGVAQLVADARADVAQFLLALVLLAAPRRSSMESRRSTLRVSAPLRDGSLMFSTLMTRRPVYSRVMVSPRPAPLASCDVPPMTPSISKRLLSPLIGTAASVTPEPPSSKLDW
jgi:hypothetical protein